MSDFGYRLNEEALLRDLERLDKNLRNKYRRRAVSAGARVLSKAYKQASPVGPTGNLKRSHGLKTKVYKESAVAVVGPRITGKYRGYHGHLVHDGHIAVDGSFVPGNPYMKRANSTAEAQADSAMVKKLAKDLERGA